MRLFHCTVHYLQLLLLVLDTKCTVDRGEGAVLQIERSLVPFQMMSLEFSIDIILPIALWPWSRISL